MMEYLLSIPGIIEKDSSIYYFEDTALYINGVTEVIENHNASLGTRIKIYSCLMPDSLSMAQNEAYQAAYSRCLKGESMIEKKLMPSLYYPKNEKIHIVSSSFLLTILTHPIAKIFLLSAAITGFYMRNDKKEIPTNALICTGALLCGYFGFFNTPPPLKNGSEINSTLENDNVLKL